MFTVKLEVNLSTLNCQGYYRIQNVHCEILVNLTTLNCQGYYRIQNVHCEIGGKPDYTQLSEISQDTKCSL